MTHAAAAGLRLSIAPHPKAAERLQLRLHGTGVGTLEADCCRPAALTAHEERDLRWYLEDYPRWSIDAALRAGEAVAARLAETGARLFTEVFLENEGTRRLWGEVCDRLDATRINVAIDDMTLRIPWELMQAPGARPLSVEAATFGYGGVAKTSNDLEPAELRKRVRLLLVTCRPALGKDIPFRSVATHIVQSLIHHPFEIRVLRPPTFEGLRDTLMRAQADGEPIDIVHFDGHGTYADLAEILPTPLVAPSSESGRPNEKATPLLPTIYAEHVQPGRRGYLYFENPTTFHNIRLIDGAHLGSLLVETGVRMLVLNACRSAAVEPAASPEDDERTREYEGERALGSVAREVLDAGARTVVAMRYNLLVDTAGRFVSAFYTSIAKRLSVGEALNGARRALYDDPVRRIGARERPMGDWLVPALYGDAETGFEALEPASDVSRETELQSAALPPPPETGFYGMDSVILEIERVFSDRSTVLLYGIAGAGKTTAAAEFARWSYRTGGVCTAPIFSSFANRNTMPMLVDQFGDACRHLLEISPTSWGMLGVTEKQRIVLKLLRHQEILWIWDNVESIGGFPEAADSPYTPDERAEIVEFLTAAVDSRVRFVLTSRRAEDPLFGVLAHPIAVRGLAEQDRASLALSIAAADPRVPTDAWDPLLEFTQGNPLAVQAVIHGALSESVSAPNEVQNYLRRLRTGGPVAGAVPGADSVVSSSIRYSIERGFSLGDRRILALLYKFQGFVNAIVISVMTRAAGSPLVEWGEGWEHDEIVRVLEQGRRIGLLTRVTDEAFLVHPLLPQVLRPEFDSLYGDIESTIEKLFCESIAGGAAFLMRMRQQGEMGAITALRFEEPNLLVALDLAIRNEWLEDVCGVLQGLEMLYRFHGRHADWKRVVGRVTPLFMTDSEQPIQEPNQGWSLLSGYNSNIAREERRWGDAERLIADRLRLAEAKAKPLLKLGGRLTDEQRDHVHNYVNALHDLAEIKRLQSDPACFEPYRSALNLAERYSTSTFAAGLASNLGHAYQELTHDLDAAEAAYDRALELTPTHDTRMRAVCLGALAGVALKRYSRMPPLPAYRRFLDRARALSEQSLQMLPADGVSDRAVIHNQLGLIYEHLEEYDKSLEHYGTAVTCADLEGELFHRLASRVNVAAMFVKVRQHHNAREFALEVLRLSESRADPGIQVIRDRARELLDDLSGE